MTVEQHDVIDFVAYDSDEDVVLMVMLEPREWGESGWLLQDLEDKLNTYYQYATQGQLVEDYPETTGKPVRIELRSVHPPGDRETRFLTIVAEKHFKPQGIRLKWKTIGNAGPAPG